jgi:hypothetical protein
VPDFIQRYPTLLRRSMPLGLVAGLEIECNWSGLPFAWTPLTSSETLGQRAGTVQILAVDSAITRAYRCKSLVRQRGGRNAPGPDLEEVLQQLFGLR